jgi:hypothetical protein
MKNTKGQPIIDGDVLAETYLTPVEERIIIKEIDGKLYWRRLMGNVADRTPINSLEGERYLTIENIYTS